MNRIRLAAAAAALASCAPAEVKWSIADPERLDPTVQAWAGCVGDDDCVVVVDLRCHAFALNKRHANAWWARPVSDEEKERAPKCMPPKGETLYAPKCGPRGLCVAVPP